MKKRPSLIPLVVMLFFSCTFFVSAGSDGGLESGLGLEFTSHDQVEFKGYLLDLRFGDAVYQEVMDDGLVTVPTTFSGKYIATLDSIDTPAIDYFGSVEIGPESNLPVGIVVSPSGYLSGKILDLNGNLVPYAQLTFQCYSSVVYDYYPLEADNIGFFSVKHMPVGSCSVTASDGEMAGSSEVKILQGEVVAIELVLDGPIAKSKKWLFGVVFILLLAGAGGAVYWLVIGKNQKKIQKRQESKKSEIQPARTTEKMSDTKKVEAKRAERRVGETDEEKHPNSPKYSKQTQALIKTLSGKEKKVVDFLLENNSNSSQAKIRHHTRIPRTSLTRTLQGLEQKKIVQIEKLGKMVSVRLTEFFLGRD